MQSFSTNYQSVKAAEQFPGRLYRTHEGRISLHPGQVYMNAKSPLRVHCNVCGHDWEASSNSLNNGHGCPACYQKRARETPGVRLSTHHSQSNKEKACELKAKGLTYKEIADKLGCSKSSVHRWLNPSSREKSREYGKDYRAKNLDQCKASQRRYSQSDKGRLDQAARVSLRNQEMEADWVGLSAEEQNQLISLIQCRNILNDEAGYVKYHIDHIYPIALGGAHAPYNLRLLAAEENISKNAKVRPEDWNLYVSRVADMFLNPWNYNWSYCS